jgi:beta-lactamase class D
MPVNPSVRLAFGVKVCLPGKRCKAVVLRHLLIPLSCCLAFTVARATPPEERPELARIFADEKVAGTFVLYDTKSGVMQVFNPARAKQRFVPASTFKITNSLIGLETGAVASADEVLPYGGKPQRLKVWEKDMSLREAIKVSNVPVYQELARRIGPKRMADWLVKLDYGNAETGPVVDRFWLDGPLAISAVEQAKFLAKLGGGRLPLRASTMAAVGEITLIEKTNGHRLYAKSGWADGPDPDIGWWVGWIEHDGRISSFALNIDIMADTDAPKRLTIGRACLKTLGQWPRGEGKQAPNP